MKGIRRLFLPHVGARRSVKHLFEEFQNSLGDRRKESLELLVEIRESDHGRVGGIGRGARQRAEFLPGELESLREVLCELLSEESCAEWLGFNDLARPDELPRARPLAGLIREPDWTDAENMHKLRMYRAAAFIDCLRPNVLDWETPHIPDMEWVLQFVNAFTRHNISGEEQSDLIADIARPRVPLSKITKPGRRERLQLTPSDLRYVWETRNLSHEERAKAWDSRTPRPFQPFGRPNLEFFRDKKLWQRWRVAVNYQISKAKALYEQDDG